MNKLEFVKNPVIAEFLGYSLDDSFTETELESSIINNLQKMRFSFFEKYGILVPGKFYAN